MSEQICKNCGKANASHEPYCYACGHILPAGEQQLSPETGMLESEPLKPQLRWGTAYFGEASLLRIRIRDANALIEAAFQHELIIGRSVDDSVPDIDLNPYDAQDYGVSRSHVKLTRESATVMVQDLGSLNGTFLNGQRLLPYQPRVLRNEDELVLGQMAMRISFCRSPKESSI